MTRTLFKGLNGSNPLGFMASVGLLRLLDGQGCHARLGFTEDGGAHAWIECDPTVDIAGVVAADASASAGPRPWRLEYEKEEKKSGKKVVADLKPPPDEFARYLVSAINEWLERRTERADYAAAYATDIAIDGNGNTKPTAFHFTAANQQFLGAVEETRARVTRDWVDESLHDREGKIKPGANLRWDPDAERSRSLMSSNPSDDDTTVNAPLEWLAFRALPAFPCVPSGNRILTCGVTGRLQNELRFHWPLWSCGASYATVRSLLQLTARWIEKEEQMMHSIEEWHCRGVFAICTSEIRRTKQGFGNFGPAHMRA